MLQGPTRRPLVSFPTISKTSGRYHRPGEAGVWYLSSREQGAWAELFRHFVDEGIDPFEVRRTVGQTRCNALAVLDLTNPAVLEQLAFMNTTSSGTTTRPAKRSPRWPGAPASMEPSLRLRLLPGQRTLVVFQHAMGKLQPLGPARIRQAPPRWSTCLGSFDCTRTSDERSAPSLGNPQRQPGGGGTGPTPLTAHICRRVK